MWIVRSIETPITLLLSSVSIDKSKLFAYGNFTQTAAGLVFTSVAAVRASESRRGMLSTQQARVGQHPSSPRTVVLSDVSSVLR